jgi:hypothetical protein
MRSVMLEEILTAVDVIAESERLRREAVETVRNNRERYKALLGQPSGWCVAVEKGWRPRCFHTALDQERLGDKIERGYRVILTVGLVAAPGTSLLRDNHVAIVSFAEPRRHSTEKLSEIAVRAKVCAAGSLHN